MFKVVAKTRKGFCKVLKYRLTEAVAKSYVRNNDWFYTDELGRVYDLFVEAMEA